MVFSLLNSYREEKDWPSLLNLGSCGSILITNSFKLECRQVNEICGKFSLITLYQGKYICELVKLMLSYWGSSLLKFCCWYTSKYTHHCSSPKDNDYIFHCQWVTLGHVLCCVFCTTYETSHQTDFDQPIFFSLAEMLP